MFSNSDQSREKKSWKPKINPTEEPVDTTAHLLVDRDGDNGTLRQVIIEGVKTHPNSETHKLPKYCHQSAVEKICMFALICPLMKKAGLKLTETKCSVIS